jgi:hypothetical protein
MVRGTFWATAIMASGCASNTVDDTDLSLSEQPAACTQDLDVGRCGTGDDQVECAGAEGEEQAFVALLEGDPIELIQGFQGSRMFALAARTSDIDPGNTPEATPDDSPLLDANIYRVGYNTLGRTRGWTPFAADPDDVNSFIATQIYVLVDDVGSGEELTADIRIEDAQGVTRCGTLDFVAR